MQKQIYQYKIGAAAFFNKYMQFSLCTHSTFVRLKSILDSHKKGGKQGLEGWKKEQAAVLGIAGRKGDVKRGGDFQIIAGKPSPSPFSCRCSSI
jgi:hypothetical protein